MTIQLQHLGHSTKPHLTVEDVSHLLRTDKETIESWLHAGAIPGYRLPDRWLIMADELQDYLTTKHNQPSHPVLPLRFTATG